MKAIKKPKKQPEKQQQYLMVPLIDIAYLLKSLEENSKPKSGVFRPIHKKIQGKIDMLMYLVERYRVIEKDAEGVVTLTTPDGVLLEEGIIPKRVSHLDDIEYPDAIKTNLDSFANYWKFKYEYFKHYFKPDSKSNRKDSGVTLKDVLSSIFQ